MSERHDGRAMDEKRAVSFERGFTCHAEGSVLVSVGRTKVLCTASVIEGVPKFLKDKNEGWVTAEYGLLPRSTGTRTDREAARGKQSGRTQEIQRLIGRSLRGVVDRTKLGQYTITLDCDVVQADGGTRTASITGAWVALHQALMGLVDAGRLPRLPLTGQVAAVSAGIVGGRALLDLDYPEDSHAEVDLNLVGTSDGGIVEVQGTGERSTLSRAQLDELLDLCQGGIARLTELQADVTGYRP